MAFGRRVNAKATGHLKRWDGGRANKEPGSAHLWPIGDESSYRCPFVALRGDLAVVPICGLKGLAADSGGRAHMVPIRGFLSAREGSSAHLWPIFAAVPIRGLSVPICGRLVPRCGQSVPIRGLSVPICGR